MNHEDILKEILKALKQNKPKATMTVLECSDYLGVSKDKIRELIHKANTDFPFFKVGTKVLIDKSRLDLWIQKASQEHRVI